MGLIKMIKEYEGLKDALVATRSDYKGLAKELNDTRKDLARLERIIKYSSNDPEKVTFRLEYNIKTKSDMFIHFAERYRTLYLYHNREEYAVALEELENTPDIGVDESSYTLEKNGEDCVIFSGRGHVFIINYKTGKYTHFKGEAYWKDRRVDTFKDNPSPTARDIIDDILTLDLLNDLKVNPDSGDEKN